MAKDIPDTTADDPLTGKPEWAMSRRERQAAARAREGRPPRRRRWPWVVLVLVIVAVAVGAWQWRERQMLTAVEDPQAAEPEAPRPTQINQDEWTALEPVTLRRTVEVIGPLQPSRRVDLSAETAGQVEAVDVRPGDSVEEGEVVVQVDVQRLTLDLNLARSNAEATQAQVTLAEQQLARAEALVERGVSAESTLDDARTNLAALQANLAAQQDQIAAAELSLEGAAVRAPFDGVVASRSVEPGSVVSAGTPLLTVVDLGRMEMLASAPVSAGAAIRAGQEVDLQVDGVDGQTFTGIVQRIAPVAEEGTRALTVYVGIENEDGVLLGGMFATGQIVVAEAEDVLAVPRDAIREEGETSFVLIVEDGAVVRRDVTVGGDWGGDLVPVEGLEAGERVVTQALPEVEAGDAIELVEF